MKQNLLKVLQLSIDLDKFYNIEVTDYSIRLQGYYTKELETKIMAMGYGFHSADDDFMRYKLNDVTFVLTSAPTDCTDCEGSGKYELSQCCGASYDSDIMICSDCKEHIGEDDLKCETCNGSGKVKED